MPNNEHLATDLARVTAKCESNENNLKEIKRTCEREFNEIKRSIECVSAKTDAIHELTTSVSVMAQGLTAIKDDIVDIKTTGDITSAKVAELENRDAKKAEYVIKTIKTAVLTAITTLVATGVATAILTLLVDK